ncbi:MAG TPA: hypothetical protein VHE35_36785, partial [Kofleriaceae bacterium]|nr:hypothetical protein [Kofleriaceae bacterium]
LPAQVEAVVHGYEAIAAAAGPDAPCASVATTIASVAVSTSTPRAVVRGAARGDHAADVDALLVAAQARLAPAMATIDAAATRCAADPSVGRALEALDR